MKQHVANGNKKAIQTEVRVEAVVLIAYREIEETTLALGIRFAFKLFTGHSVKG
jgi:hypothetical protein